MFYNSVVFNQYFKVKKMEQKKKKKKNKLINCLIKGRFLGC